ncbi:uncharacterized protein LOC130191310 [Pseudoliparis swirei]|uniref:uncharacterized protein LOC130191310 n=1 Tax=Pseudoliparis swirei TaxID=2059687 RepID=UPI0024BEE232|nr:uncharacterized protein LOC130191310 [Pseudoliparis swirei]
MMRIAGSSTSWSWRLLHTRGHFNMEHLPHTSDESDTATQDVPEMQAGPTVFLEDLSARFLSEAAERTEIFKRKTKRKHLSNFFESDGFDFNANALSAQPTTKSNRSMRAHSSTNPASLGNRDFCQAPWQSGDANQSKDKAVSTQRPRTDANSQRPSSINPSTSTLDNSRERRRSRRCHVDANQSKYKAVSTQRPRTDANSDRPSTSNQSPAILSNRRERRRLHVAPPVSDATPSTDTLAVTESPVADSAVQSSKELKAMVHILPPRNVFVGNINAVHDAVRYANESQGHGSRDTFEQPTQAAPATTALAGERSTVVINFTSNTADNQLCDKGDDGAAFDDDINNFFSGGDYCPTLDPHALSGLNSATAGTQSLFRVGPTQVEPGIGPYILNAIRHDQMESSHIVSPQQLAIGCQLSQAHQQNHNNSMDNLPSQHQSVLAPLQSQEGSYQALEFTADQLRALVKQSILCSNYLSNVHAAV